MKILSSLFDNVPQHKDKPMLFHDDPVALACAAYREGNYPRLETMFPIPQDRAMASNVRQHFMNKLVLQRLRGQTASGFREKLGAFLVDNRQLLESEIGILYQLPYFYQEDIDIQSLMDSTVAVPSNHSEHRVVVLKPYRTFSLKRRGGTIRQYWWIDSGQKPYCLNIRESGENQLLYQSIWEFASIRVDAHMLAKPFVGTDKFYYKLVGTRLLAVE